MKKLSTVKVQMKIFRYVTLIGFMCSSALAGDDPFAVDNTSAGKISKHSELINEYSENLEKVRHKYRKGIANLILDADKADLFIVKFDELNDEDPFGDGRQKIKVAPYNKLTPVIKKKTLPKVERVKLLKALSDQLRVKGHSGGAFCHYPIHGLKIYKKNELILESTFCWICGNFGFEYPDGAEWLDTNEELKEVFTELLPIPQSEKDRFKKEYNSGIQPSSEMKPTKPQPKSGGE